MKSLVDFLLEAKENIPHIFKGNLILYGKLIKAESLNKNFKIEIKDIIKDKEVWDKKMDAYYTMVYIEIDFNKFNFKNNDIKLFKFINFDDTISLEPNEVTVNLRSFAGKFILGTNFYFEPFGKCNLDFKDCNLNEDELKELVKYIRKEDKKMYNGYYTKNNNKKSKIKKIEINTDDIEKIGNYNIKFITPDADEIYDELKKRKITDAKYKLSNDGDMSITFNDKSDEFVKWFFGSDVYNELDKDPLISGWLNVYYDALWSEVNGEIDNQDVPSDFEPQEIFGYECDTDFIMIMKIAYKKLNELGYKFKN